MKTSSLQVWAVLQEKENGNKETRVPILFFNIVGATRGVGFAILDGCVQSVESESDYTFLRYTLGE